MAATVVTRLVGQVQCERAAWTPVQSRKELRIPDQELFGMDVVIGAATVTVVVSSSVLILKALITASSRRSVTLAPRASLAEARYADDCFTGAAIVVLVAPARQGWRARTGLNTAQAGGTHASLRTLLDMEERAAEFVPVAYIIAPEKSAG